MRRSLLSLLVAFSLANTLLAHPVPRDNRDRTIVVRITPTSLIVDYRLEVDETSLVRELTREEAAKVTSRADLLEIFSKSFGETANRNLDATLDGQELHFQCVDRKVAATDHVRCDYRFVAPLSLQPGSEHKLKFHECNYVTDEFSRLCLSLEADNQIHIVSRKAPGRRDDEAHDRSTEAGRQRQIATRWRRSLRSQPGRRKPCRSWKSLYHPKLPRTPIPGVFLTSTTPMPCCTCCSIHAKDYFSCSWARPSSGRRTP